MHAQPLTTTIEETCYICRATVHRRAVLYEPAICDDCATAARELGFNGDCLYLGSRACVAILRHRLAGAEKPASPPRGGQE